MMNRLPLVLFVWAPALGAVVTLAGCERQCDLQDPTVRLELRFGSPALRQRATAYRIQPITNAQAFVAQCYPLDPGDLRETQDIAFGDDTLPDTFEIDWTIELLDGALLNGDLPQPCPTVPRDAVISEAKATTTIVANACDNVLVVELGPNTGSDTGPVDTGPVDPPDPVLRASPGRARQPWADIGPPLVFEILLSDETGVLDLSETTITAEAPASWMEISYEPTADRDKTAIIRIDTTHDEVPRDYAASLRFEADGATVDVPVAFRLFTPVHVGPTVNACPHEGASGPVSLCDHFGDGGLQDATNDNQPYPHIIMHNNGGNPFEYRGPIDVNHLSWISGAPDAAPASVVVRQPSRCSDGNGVIDLNADGIRLEGFTLISASECIAAVSSWRGGNRDDRTRDHEIRRMVIATYEAEYYGVNNITQALALSETTTVANCHIHGFFESMGDLSGASGTLIAHNTFVFFQKFGSRFPPPGAEGAGNVRGTQDISIVNTGFIALPNALEPLLQADIQTENLMVQGNTFFGFTSAQATQFGQDLTRNNVDADPRVGVRLKSPYEPLFLDTPAPPAVYPGLELSGRSLDDVPLENGVAQGEASTIPGAFQKAVAGSPSTRIRLGPESCSDCDIRTSAENEVQLAVWNLWPGGRLEIRPGRYAGNAIVTWPVVISGTGTPEETILENRVENILWRENDLFRLHSAVLVATPDAEPGFLVERLTLEVSDLRSPAVHALLLEGTSDSDTRHRIRNVIVKHTSTPSDPPSNVPQAAVVVGDRSFIQDTLIQGPWKACASAQFRNTDEVFSDIELINITCRLNGTGDFAPDGGIQISRVERANIFNWILEAPDNTPATVLYNQEELLPDSFQARAVHYRGFANGPGFTTGGTLIVDVDALTEPQTFVSEDDSRLIINAQSRDTGLLPSAFSSRWVEGRGLDDQPRGPTNIDRGAYEQ